MGRLECRCGTASRSGELARLARSGPRHRGGAQRRAGRRLAAGRSALDATGLPFVPPSPNLRDAREPLSLSGHLPVRGHQPLGRPGNRRRRSSRSGAPWLDTGGRARRAAQAALPGVAFARHVTSRRGSRATGSTPTPCLPGSGSRSPTARRYDPTGHRAPPPDRDPAGASRPSSPGFRRTSTGWPGPARLREAHGPGCDPADSILAVWEPELAGGLCCAERPGCASYPE